MTDNATKPIHGGKCDVDALNELLKGELSAVETYEQALGKFDDASTAGVAGELRRIRDEHGRAAGVLRDRVRAYGGSPAEGSGAWGWFAGAVEGAAKLLGPQTALSALRRGEDHGVGEYDAALANDEVSVECKYLIRNDLLPRCRDHIAALDRLTGQLKAAG